MEKERRLKDLPKSESDFWDGETETKEVKPIKCEHYFKLFDREIKCIHCGTGYFVNVNDEVKDGHLYHEGKLVV